MTGSYLIENVKAALLHTEQGGFLYVICQSVDSKISFIRLLTNSDRRIIMPIVEL